MFNRIIFALMVSTLLTLASCSSNEKSHVNIETYKILGDIEFSSSLWKSSSQEVRATMVYDLLKNKSLLGKSRKEVINLLGKPTSYYDYDEFPAYVVGPKTVSSEYANGYVLAFIIDESSGKIVKFEFVPKIQ